MQASTYISPFADSRLTFRRVDYTWSLFFDKICCELTGPDALPRLQTNRVGSSSHRLHPVTTRGLPCEAGPQLFAVLGIDSRANARGSRGSRLSAANRPRIRDATSFAPTAVVSGRMTTNSSPPYLAAVSIARQSTRRTSAKRHSASLPIKWP